MKFEVSLEAANWYKKEMDVKQGDYVQYYVQLYGGIPTAHPNYSLGMSIGKEGDIAVKDVVEGITFYFNKNNSWFLNEFDMKVVVEGEELAFVFHEK
ncbi:HesB/YadR/YfhF family protein [Sporosarcina koreensis]|uniref:HesB/YadR/YfhF family protein n=1 Tax=Sporosarcina koreensis TaxID=334735 RepID=UPI00075C871F|nr:hypothetical protein [Sporosarcina koreensis]